MDRPLVAVVLAGGTGTRLYPASTAENPKQFQSFGGDRSMLEATVDRLDADETYVLTRPDLAGRVREELPGVGVLTEPEPKDTGPALVYAAHRIREQVGECVLACVPSDHYVPDGEAFAETIRHAAGVAVETNGLVTLGVEPTRPDTGYGYIKPGDAHDGYETVSGFYEKPDAGAAQRYVHHGFYWNAGMFVWTPDAFLREAQDSALGALVDALDADDPEEGFAAVDPVSVDYAVMEETDEAYVVAADFAWDDVGSWDALERVLDSGENGNVALGDTLAIDAEDNVLATDSHVSVVGVSDLVVASYGGRTLVVPKADAQRVREVVSALESGE